MLVLGIETSTTVSSIALGARNGVRASQTIARGRGHVEFLIPAITSMCAQAGVDLGAITGVAVGLGPGLFTGMRVGITTAKTLAQMLHVPIVGVSSLDVLAYGVRHSPKRICACVDARRGEVYAATYRRQDGGVRREGDEGVWAPEALAAALAERDESVLFAGDGAVVYAEAFRDLAAEVASPTARYPLASSLVELALPLLEREDLLPVEQIAPRYVRRSDAEIKWEERGVSIERPLRVRISKRVSEA